MFENTRLLTHTFFISTRNSIVAASVFCSLLNMSLACSSHDLWVFVDDGAFLHLQPNTGEYYYFFPVHPQFFNVVKLIILNIMFSRPYWCLYCMLLSATPTWHGYLDPKEHPIQFLPTSKCMMTWQSSQNKTKTSCILTQPRALRDHTLHWLMM